MAKSKKSLAGFAKSGIASMVRLGAAFAGIGLVKGIIGLGTSAAETASKFNSVFGPAADAMNERVQELRKIIPATTAEMQNSLATFAQMASAFGLNEKAAGMFSVQMVKIAGDIASFNDLPIEEAFTKIRSAISGEFEPMKQLGIVINEARLKQEGLNLAIFDGTGQMSAAQKALAVQSILIRDMGVANGDAALTADSAANRIKFLRATLIETGTTIGVTALPAILALTNGLATMLEKTKEFADFVGSTAGEMIYGPTPETLERQNKAIQLFDAQKQAMRELTAEGELYKQGIFEGTLFTAGLSEKLAENEIKIKARTDSILKGLNAEKTAAKEVEAERIKSSNEAIKESKNLAEEIERQAKAETDPARKKALEDRLQSVKSLIAAAGQLNSVQKVKPGSRASTGSASASSSASDAVATPDERPDSKIRGKIRSFGLGTQRSKFGRKQTMSERERAAGLELAGNNTMSGRQEESGAFGEQPSGKSGDKGAKAIETNSEKQTTLLESIDREIKKNP